MVLTAPYIAKQKKFFLDEKNAKITKQSHAYRGFASTYNFKILDSFNPELQLKDTESGIKNKLVNLLSELRGFKFLTILVAEFKKIENDDETKYSTFPSNSKAETSINEMMIYSNQFILQIYQTYKHYLERFWLDY